MLVPELEEENDVVCVFWGAQTPFLLRKKQNEVETRWELVGECYVHGIMDGKLFKYRTEETFIIV